MGLDVANVAYFMAAGIVGGAALQYPLGLLSDRLDRRWVLIGTTLCASATGLVLSGLNSADPIMLFAASFAFGAFALPLYSLSVAHANDHAKPNQFALLSAGLIFVYSLGAVVGPLGASLVIEHFGAPAFFAYVSAIHACLVLVTVVRMRMRTSVPLADRGRYVPLMRTSPALFKLAKRSLRPVSPTGADIATTAMVAQSQAETAWPPSTNGNSISPITPSTTGSSSATQSNTGSGATPTPRPGRPQSAWA